MVVGLETARGAGGGTGFADSTGAGKINGAGDFIFGSNGGGESSGGGIGVLGEVSNTQLPNMPAGRSP